MAVLIVFSMIFAYSGFTSLSTTATQQQIEIPPEVQAQLDLQRSGITADGKASTPEEQAILDAIAEGRLDIDPSSTSGQAPSNTSGQDPETNEDETVVPPQEGAENSTQTTQELKLEI